MRLVLWLALLTALSLAMPVAAQKRLIRTDGQYVLPGFGGRVAVTAEVELALDVNGGRDKCYLYGPPDPTNWNHLWRVTPVGDAVMFVSRVDGLALDANAGRGNPYPRPADPANVNHLWILAKVGDHVMVWSKAAPVVLDANGGRDRPYLNGNPDPRNVNHLWSLRKVGDDVMIVPKVRRQVVTAVGQLAPPLEALLPDGNPLRLDQLRDMTVLISCWSVGDRGGQRHLDLLRGLRAEFAAVERFQMVSVCLDDDWDAWLALLNRQRPPDDRSPLQPFASDARWWQALHRPQAAAGRDAYQVAGPPQSFLIGPDGRLLAVGVPDEHLHDAVATALNAGAPR